MYLYMSDCCRISFISYWCYLVFVQWVLISLFSQQLFQTKPLRLPLPRPPSTNQRERSCSALCVEEAFLLC